MAWLWEVDLWMTTSVYLKNRQYDREMLLLVMDLKEGQILFIFSETMLTHLGSPRNQDKYLAQSNHSVNSE